MKELLTLNANFLAAWDDEKKLNRLVEVILIISEPKYLIDAGGKVTRHREADPYRMIASPTTLRILAEKFQNLADEVESLPLPNAQGEQSPAKKD